MSAEGQEADRAPPAGAASSHPPSESELPPEELLDADGLDIDALLPATFESGSARIAMGQDLVDLLRAAEERIEARSEPSRALDAPVDDAVALVPVPDDVLMLLAEPLEGSDDESPTGAHQESAPGATNDGVLATPHGMEEDLEQPLPRASDVPRATTAAHVTGAGRPEPSLEASRGAATRPGDSEAPAARGDAPPPRTSERSMRFAEGPSPERGPTTWERGITSPERAAPSLERGATTWERSVTSPERGPHSLERGPHSLERGPHSLERGATTWERSVTSPERGAPPPERGPAPVDRGAPFADDAGDLPVIERPAIAERPGMRTIETSALERASPAERSAMRTVEMRAIERPSPAGDGARPAQRGAPPIEASEGGSRVRSAPTDAAPAVLGPGDAARALGRSIAARVSGALLVTSGDDQRRILLHDGDVVTAGSSAPVESLVAFLAARGDLDRDLVPRMAGKLPAFGRHAGAALVAHGHLGQDDLWPVLRAHSEWIIGRALLVESGTCELEPDPPPRFKAEPSVFGGATGAEVFVDVVQRVIAPEAALARLGGYGARFAQGPRAALLGECALGPTEQDAVRAAPGRTVHELTGDGPTDRWSMLHALVCLDVLEVLPAVAAAPKREESKVDPLDEEALRQRVRARLALVEEGDYFALLGVPRAATSYEIRRAYLDLRRALEPSRVLTAGTADLAGDLRVVLEVVEEAYEILRDAHRRDRYRRAIEAGPPR